MSGAEIGVLIKVLIIVPAVIAWGYPRGYYDWVLPNRFKKNKRRK